MSLRDWFASQAITGILAAEAEMQSQGTYLDYDTWAHRAYEFANAMLKARPEASDDDS